MTDLNKLLVQVKRNCEISDARYWGNYTLCTALLWMRELYRFENRINLWEDVDKNAVLDWISEKEKLWNELCEEDFKPILIGGKSLDPFDAESINREIIPQGIFYGAGYGPRMKPSFFVAELERHEFREGYNVYITGMELVRDLTYYPAMLQEKNIIVRKSAILLLLWDRFNEMRSSKLETPLTRAFGIYGVQASENPSEAINTKLSNIAESQTGFYLYHEIGEATEGEKLGDEWKGLLLLVSNSRAEHLARGVKDILADTSQDGMLRQMIDLRETGHLAYYSASMRGYRRQIFEKTAGSLEELVKSNNWDKIEQLRKDCYEKAQRYAKTLIDLYMETKERNRLIEKIEKEFSSLL